MCRYCKYLLLLQDKMYIADFKKDKETLKFGYF